MKAANSATLPRLGDKASGLTFSVKDSRDNEIAKGTANLNAFGAFDFKFKLPDNANLGYSRIDISTNSSLSGSTYQHNFQIQEFRRPEFEVKAKNETEAPYLVGTSANVAVTANYFAGGGLANADVNWTVRATPTNYTPPNRGDFIFGKWIPWWYFGDYNDYANQTVQNFKGITDASGKHVLKIDFESVKPPRPYSVTASGAVQDVNRQTWSASTSLLVHPADLYIGVKSARNFVQKGEKMVVESIVTNIDGEIVAGRDAEIKAVLKDWVFDKGAWTEKTIDEQICNFKSANEVAKCEFIAKQGGRYIITATVMDDRERFNETRIYRLGSGRKNAAESQCRTGKSRDYSVEKRFQSRRSRRTFSDFAVPECRRRFDFAARRNCQNRKIYGQRKFDHFENSARRKISAEYLRAG